MNYFRNPNNVPWKRFLTVEKYKGRVGIIEQKVEGYQPYYIPAEYTIMSYKPPKQYYDSPSRYAVFRTIYWCSNVDTATMTGPTEEEMWEAFLEYDVVNDHPPY